MPPREKQERRPDPNERGGARYTKAQFVDLYGSRAGGQLWARAAPQERRPDPTDPGSRKKYTLAEFIEFYGPKTGQKRWDQAAKQGGGGGGGGDKKSKEQDQLEKVHVVTTDSPIHFADCKVAWDGLTEQERLYAHHLCHASWHGGLICLLQSSPEAGDIFALLQDLFRDSCTLAGAVRDAGITKRELDQIMVYAAAFYHDLGNYRGFGATKIVPGIPSARFELLCKKAGLAQGWRKCGRQIYSLTKREREQKLPPVGVSSYYSANIVEEDVLEIDKWMADRKMYAYNTRLFKEEDGTLQLRIASACSAPEKQGAGDRGAANLGDHELKSGKKLKVIRGDYAPLMQRVCDSLRNAQKVACNDTQNAFLEKYIASFMYGSVEDHVDGSAIWVDDKGPAVESTIGFIESYQDPHGVRGQWEGFAAVVNKEQGKAFQQLVDAATTLIPKLPWEPVFEKDTYQRPDFTSLDIIGFSGAPPIGINIPNYDEVRQGKGFKNVSLGNIISARVVGTKDTRFLKPEDLDLLYKHLAQAYDLQVGIHELLGHGSGKLFEIDDSGKITNLKGQLPADVTPGGYSKGQTWDSVFTKDGSPIEECRAEAIAIYLGVEPEATKIWGKEGKEADDLYYAAWLSMARQGVDALRFWSPEHRAFTQAHMHGRFVILRVMVDAGQGFVRVEQVKGQKGKDLRIHMDRSKILSVGVPAIGKFLRQMQAYKSTANVTAMREWWNKWSEVNDEWQKCRDIVMMHIKPRGAYVQCHTYLNHLGKAQLRTYPKSLEGMVRSFRDRFPEPDQDLAALVDAERQYHRRPKSQSRKVPVKE
eukprot:TRINITY_DN2350_c0_g1_i1.p2 TRINITY_DN2350_c0_g1~~TRINITY_DN2350_c0_g1_i1.p2  ORF type:complete len:853 (+),score=326.41 TRINITY_DN2350_c0_g1_i1:112-2559(+)